ncbi:hypothetical protein AALP_AA4G046400 [Arabis alpina]|uniref:alanine--tRNA ligase n=1 Tax=Arabis alpina TaxID=50452 RepID=A0A087H159_ARAAL|nr:hypothetical protein AALP_AA4G046400 [Arabis alpina]
MSEKTTELKWPATKVRETFVDFFMSKEHTLLPSFSVIPKDPSPLFTQDGMDLETIKQHDKELKRACYYQKCIIAAHEELESVGTLNYPHTFFEMLSNWSFGDYFKKEAIEWAWELLTKVYRILTDQIYVSYFGGDSESGLQVDEETRDTWLQFLPPERVLPFGYRDNFWEMGGTSSMCGPYTKVHYNRLANQDAASLVNKEDQISCIEIWNLVFIQLEKDSNGSLKPLPTKYVSTRMNLERLTSVLQNRITSYDTDIFLPIYDHIHKATGIAKYDGQMGYVTDAYRVVADHLRTMSFAIADGLRPGDAGREYALRRVFLQAVRCGMQFLGGKEGFFSGVASSIVGEMGGAFPELKAHEETISKTIQQEEAVFCKIMVTETFKDLAILLWYSRDAFTMLLAEITSISPSCVIHEEYGRLSKLLRLIKCLASHSETRTSLIKASIQSYLYLYIQQRSTNLTTSIVQRHCLDILFLLLKIDDIKSLLESGIIEVCIHAITDGSTRGLDDRVVEVALSILKSILKNQGGFAYITSEEERFLEVFAGLATVINSKLACQQTKRVNAVIECYLLLSKDKRACEALVMHLPVSLGTFRAQIRKGANTSAVESLNKLLHNVKEAGP